MSRNVVLVGPMHAGKSTIAHLLVENWGYERIALADSVKDDAVYLVNQWFSLYGIPSEITRIDIEANKAQFRPFLQWLGTELGREFTGNDRFWIDQFLGKVNWVDGPVVCDDCRFPNEAEALRAAGFLVVRVVRPEEQRAASVAASGQAGLPGHASETEIEQIRPDLYVYNEHEDSPAVLASMLAAWPELESRLW